MKGYLVLLFVLPLVLGACTMYDKGAGLAPGSKPHAGRGYYLRECGTCHKLYRPNEYTAEQWQPILHRMRNKVSLTNVQYAKMSDFLQGQAGAAASVK